MNEDWMEHVSNRQVRNRLRKRYPSLYVELLGCLARGDFLGLIAMGAPADEYDPELAAALPQLVELHRAGKATVSAVQTVLHETFVKKFDLRMAGPPERYSSMADEWIRLLDEAGPLPPWRMWPFPDDPAEYDDDYGTCSKTFATFRVLGVAPEAVTAALNLEPTRTRVKGQRWMVREGWSRSPAHASGWSLCSKGQVESRDVRRHVDWLLELLKPRSDVLIELQDNQCLTDIVCFWESAPGHGGPTLSPPQLRFLADLRLSIWFDVYVWDKDEPADGPGTAVDTLNWEMPKGTGEYFG